MNHNAAANGHLRATYLTNWLIVSVWGWGVKWLFVGGGMRGDLGRMIGGQDNWLMASLNAEGIS